MNWNAYTSKTLERLGINPGNQGYVGIELGHFPEWVRNLWSREMAYDASDDPKFKHVNGFDALENKPHITLKYGLWKPFFRSVREAEDIVHSMLRDWERPEKLKLTSLGMFQSPDMNRHPYSCIWSNVDITAMESFREANKRLSALPHLDTHMEFRAHVTLGYVKQVFADSALNQMGAEFAVHLNRGGYAELDLGELVGSFPGLPDVPHPDDIPNSQMPDFKFNG